jgi:4-carboxymuconolactone decarboxylase
VSTQTETSSSAGETGRAIIAELRGNAFFEHRKKTQNDFNAVLNAYADEVCFGRIWARDGLERKQRSILNIAMLTALNRPNQLRSHIDGAINMGCTVREIQEILLQAAVYCGLPAAVDAFRIAEEVLKERKLL